MQPGNNPPPPPGYGTQQPGYGAPSGYGIAQPGPYAGGPPPGWSGSPLNIGGLGFNDFQPVKSKRHPILMTIAVLSFIAGGILLTVGILRVVDEASNIRDGSVATGQVATPETEPAVAEFTSSGSSSYTVYIDLNTSDENVRDDVVSSTTCVAQMRDGRTATMRGSRQGASETLGDLSSIGRFTASEGQVKVICQQARDARPGLTFLVTPGTPDLFKGIGMIFGGAGLLAVALVCAIFGFRRTYQTTTIAA